MCKVEKIQLLISSQCIFKKIRLNQKIKKKEKVIKINKKSTNPQNIKTQKQPNLSIFCISNNEFNNIFNVTGCTYKNVSFTWEIAICLNIHYGRNSKILN